jgi:hypothetical protein
MSFRLNIVAAVILVVTFTASCRDRELDELQRVKDQVCACKTIECAEQALAAMPTGEMRQPQKAKALAAEILDCYSARVKPPADDKIAPSH